MIIIIIIIIIIIYLFTAIGLSPGGSGYFTCKQNMKLVSTEFIYIYIKESRKTRFNCVLIVY